MLGYLSIDSNLNDAKLKIPEKPSPNLFKNTLYYRINPTKQHPPIKRFRRISPLFINNTRFHIGQQFQRLINGTDGIDVELTGLGGVDDIPAQHQVFDVGGGDETPWLPVKPFLAQISKKPSIFSLTPPIGCTLPSWLIEPVMARSCLNGIWTSGYKAQQDQDAFRRDGSAQFVKRRGIIGWCLVSAMQNRMLK